MNDRRRSIRVACLLASLIAPALAVRAPAAPAEGVLTPHRVAALRAVTQVRISPDGGRIAYVLLVPRTPGEGDDGPAWTELHVVDRDGRSRPFVTGEVNVGSIDWTPDGTGISFLAKRGGDKHRSLHVIPLDGGEARKAAELKSDISGYSWSPDGKQVALIATPPEPEAVEKRKKKGFNQEIYEEDWRPARAWLAVPFEKKQGPRELEIEGSASHARWSPRGDRLAVVAAPTPLVDDGYMRQRIRIVDVETGKVVARIENPGKLGAVEWSPDGERVAFLSAADLNDPSSGRLMVGDAGSGRFTDVLPGLEGDVDAFEWKDAETLMLVGSRGVWTVLETVRRDGTARVEIVATGGPTLTALSLSRDGRHAAFIADSPAHPPEVYASDPGGDAPRRLTDSNPWLPGLRMARQEVVTFEARDGLRLEGVLIRPLEEQAGGRHPLILTVHGGPEAHYRNGWLTSYSNPGQVAAARGIAVFHPNYRGSTGRGVAFSKLSQGDPAGREFDDLVDAADHLVAKGLVDKEKVGVTGGSYGGYATAWCATRLTDRFAAGVMFVGISNKISKVGTTDIPEEEFHVHALSRPWEDWGFLLERSPITHARGARTPVLILHGKEDPRVNVGQSRELYRHLKLAGKAPVRLVLYPGEQHGNRRAASRLDYNLRMLRWMEHYLKGPGGEPPPYEIDTADPEKAKETPEKAGAG